MDRMTTYTKKTNVLFYDSFLQQCLSNIMCTTTKRLSEHFERFSVV